MIYWIAPALVSYLAYVFFAEEFNPLKNRRKARVRRRTRRGQIIALTLLPIGYGLVFAQQIAS